MFCGHGSGQICGDGHVYKTGTMSIASIEFVNIDVECPVSVPHSARAGNLRLECPHLRFVLPTAPSRPITPSSSLCMGTWLYHSPAFIAEMKRGPARIKIPHVPDSEDDGEGGGERGEREDGAGGRRGGRENEEEGDGVHGKEEGVEGEEEKDAEHGRYEGTESNRERGGMEGWKAGDVDVLTGAEAPMSYRTRMQLPTRDSLESKQEGVGESKGKGIAERKGDATRELRCQEFRI